MNKLEAKAIIEATGNYDEEEEDEIMEIYGELEKHIGFKDNRRDSRYIVKFHDIFYYMPDEYYKEHGDEINSLFDDFCMFQSELIEESDGEKYIDIDSMLTQQCVGHYRAFIVDIPEITKENIAELAMRIYDEFSWEGKEYPSNYVTIVNELQDLEDNYMEYWFNFIEDAVPEDVIKEMKDAYEKDKKRRK